MANLIRSNHHYATVELRIPRADFNALVDAAGGVAFALRDLRQATPRLMRALTLELARGQADPARVAPPVGSAARGADDLRPAQTPR